MKFIGLTFSGFCILIITVFVFNQYYVGSYGLVAYILFSYTNFSKAKFDFPYSCCSNVLANFVYFSDKKKHFS